MEEDFIVVSETPTKQKRVYRSLFEKTGKEYIHIREFYKDRNSEEWRPTQKGITFTDEDLADLQEAIEGV